MPLTQTGQIALIALLVIPLVYLVGKWVHSKLTETSLEMKRLTGGVVTVWLGAGIFLGALFIVSPGVLPSSMYQPAAAPTAPTGPGQQISIGNYGYAAGQVTDQYKSPTEYLNANVTATLSEPTREGGINGVKTVGTGSDGQFEMQIDDVTGGTVYLVADENSGTYYPDVESTTIPGPATRPGEALKVDLDLAKIETNPSISISDNTGYASLSGGTITVDNESSVQSFTLEISVPSAYEAIRDLQITEVRGASWENVNGVSVQVSEVPSGVDVSTEGDITLADDYTASIKCNGDVTWGDTVAVTLKVNHDQVNSSKLLELQSNDLFGQDTVFGNGAWSGQNIPVQTK